MEPDRQTAAAPSEPIAELVIRFEDWTRRVPFGSEPLELGRAEDCGLPLPDRKLSRHHCRLTPQDNGWLLEDLGSRAGTLLAGALLTEPALLRPGQAFQIGSTHVLLQPRPSGRSVLSGDLLRDQRNVELLLRTVDDLYGTASLEELLRTIVDRAILLAGGDRGAILLAGPGETLEAGVARDSGGRDLPPEQTLTRSLPARALKTGGAVVLTDAQDPGQRHDATPSVLLGGLRSVLCAPLPGPDKNVGVLYVDGSKSAEDFGPAELAAFEALAVHGALAIERARFREETERREREARQKLEAENTALRVRLEAAPPIGQSEPMRRVLDLVRRFAPTDATVCLTGETGTGKEVIARYLHQLSSRSRGPFVVVDCGALPEGLIESELFGHQQGAFTGAVGARKGLFREAQEGTVFLDEVGELPLELQTRLLRVLQERSVQPLGSSVRVPIDVRVVCATHRDLRQRVAEGAFREDLYYRLGALQVPIPPLRERGEDILLLARHFLNRFAASYGIGVSGFTREAVEALYAHEWRGNVRELEHRVQRAILLASPPFVTRQDLDLEGGWAGSVALPVAGGSTLPALQQARGEVTERFERAYLEELLRQAQGSMEQASSIAGVSRQLLHRLLRRYGLDRRQFAEGPGPEAKA
jgi:transcriptional regulator with GAF, ATPase, and Fis domain